MMRTMKKASGESSASGMRVAVASRKFPVSMAFQTGLARHIARESTLNKILSVPTSRVRSPVSSRTFSVRLADEAVRVLDSIFREVGGDSIRGIELRCVGLSKSCLAIKRLKS